MPQRNEIRFRLNDREIALPDVGAARTLLDFLRLDQRLTGTKEGCAEGDCGACTVLVGRLDGRIDGGTLRYEPVNACIRFLASVDGCHVVTVEHLSSAGGALHPVQQAMVAEHGSQCGFCTPGIVMALYALWMETPDPDPAQIETALQGNLCRCTGYAPIIRAAQSAARYGTPAADRLMQERDRVTAALAAMRDGARVVTGPEDDRAILPADVEDFAEVLADSPHATIVAGATDVGLWVTKFLRPIGPAIFIGHLDELTRIAVDATDIRIGAGLSYSGFEPVIAEHFPFMADYWHRIAGWQVRNAGTIGGNIANGSPIGDTPPALIALGASITLRHRSTRRSLPLEAFFVDYGKQDRAPGEFVEEICIPRLAPDQIVAAYKVSKRRDEDISSVAVGISVTRHAGRITACRIACGGMAATPKRAAHAEAALTGQPWGQAAFEAAMAVLPRDFTPLTDMRASAEYRMRAAQNLLLRFYLEHEQGPAARLSA